MSAIGPWSNVSGATNPVYTTTNITQNIWYRAIVSCSTTSGGTTLTPLYLQVAGTTTSSVPYFESFENVGANNLMPNCSWAVSSTSNCLTYTAAASNNRIPRTGSKFASFYYSSSGTYYYYTNGMYLQPGITYSAGLWYTSEQNSYTNFSNLSILYGTSQSSSGLTGIASTSGPAASPAYTPLSNTFQVSSAVVATGIYAGERTSFDISNFANGVYSVRVLSGDKTEVLRLMKD